MKISDVARATGIHRNGLTLMYKETIRKVDLEEVNRLCEFFDCSVGELFEYVADSKT